MRKTRISIMLLGSALSLLGAARDHILHSGVNPIEVTLNGKALQGGWWIESQVNPDILETSASKIVFSTDKDTLVIDDLKEWGTRDFTIVTNEGDSAHIRVKRTAINPYENPDPEFLKIAESGKLSKQQAIFDIDALVYGISQIHPDMMSVCRQEDLFRTINRAKKTLPDSVSVLQLYKAVAPIVAMIGDGHTNLYFPYNNVFTKELKRFPVFVNVLTDRSIICTKSLDSIIAPGDRILSINDISADSIVKAMMPYVSGERPHFKISRIDKNFQGLFSMLFASDNYSIKYQPKGTKKVYSHVFPALTLEEIRERSPLSKNSSKPADYSYSIDSVNDVAIMDFRRFYGIKQMEEFADSMFTELADKNVTNLIIDIRYNGGGNSKIGDIMLRYISPEPFTQMEKALIRDTPLIAKLTNSETISPTYFFYETDSTNYIKPRSIEEGRFTGNVYLLTSNKTFSSAGSFAWTFKECGIGKVIGEETGGMNVSYGDILTYTLPVSKLSTSVSYKRFWQFRADENDIHGTIPDVEVPAADALDAAMKLIKKNKRKR